MRKVKLLSLSFILGISYFVRTTTIVKAQEEFFSSENIQLVEAGDDALIFESKVRNSDGSISVIQSKKVTLEIPKEKNNSRSTSGWDSSYSVYATINTMFEIYSDDRFIRITGVSGNVSNSEPTVRVKSQKVWVVHSTGNNYQEKYFYPTGSSFSYSVPFIRDDKYTAVLGSTYTLTLGRNSSSSNWTYVIQDNIANTG